MCRKRLSSPRCRSELIDSASVVIVPGQKCINKNKLKKLKELRVEITGRFHSTKLKKRIISQFEDLYEYKEGGDIILAFKGDIGNALSSSASIDCDDEGYILAEATRIIRRDIKKQKYETFVGKFGKNCH